MKAGLLEVRVYLAGDDPNAWPEPCLRRFGRPVITWKFATLKPLTQWPAVRTFVGAITDPPQCSRPLR